MHLEIHRIVLPSYAHVVTWVVICALFFLLEVAEVIDGLSKFTF